MLDVTALETRLSSDKGYTGESPAKEGLPGFVCPRADAYGGRNGIISPGVAVVHGLVPKGMKHISTADVARAANEARDSGVSEAEQYREYYRKGAAASALSAPEAPAPEPVPPPAPPPAPAKPAPRPKAKARGRATPPAPPAPPAPPVPAPSSRQPPAEHSPISDPDDPGMFSRHAEPYRAEDTLDGFYEEIGRSPAGTAGPGGGASGKASVQASVQGAGTAAGAPEVPGGAARPLPGVARVAPLPPDQMGAALASLVAERDRLAEMASALGQQVDELRGRLEGYEMRDTHYANIERELRGRRAAEEVPPETVRVVLSAQEGRLKVGGRGWECNIVGTLHAGRTGRSFVLTVSDPAYASELIAEIQPGEVVVLSAEGRTSCTYSGRCAKIYGDAGSPDFIAVFWLEAGPA